MSAPLRWLIVCGALIAAPALAQDRSPPPPPAQTAPDGGTALSQEDQEIVQNLDLLENMDASQELDTLLAMGEAQEGDAQASGSDTDSGD